MKQMKVIWTRHAEDRQKEWEKKLGVTREEVETLLNSPEQIVPGDREILIAQGRSRNGLLRAPFVEVEGSRKIITVYWTSRANQYWKED